MLDGVLDGILPKKWKLLLGSENKEMFEKQKQTILFILEGEIGIRQLWIASNGAMALPHLVQNRDWWEMPQGYWWNLSVPIANAGQCHGTRLQIYSQLEVDKTLWLAKTRQGLPMQKNTKSP